MSDKSKSFSLIWKHLIKHWGIHNKRGERCDFSFSLCLFTPSCLRANMEPTPASRATVVTDGSTDALTRRVHLGFTRPSRPGLSVSRGLLCLSPWQKNSKPDRPNGPQGPGAHTVNYPGNQQWAVGWGALLRVLWDAQVHITWLVCLRMGLLLNQNKPEVGLPWPSGFPGRLLEVGEFTGVRTA